MSTPLNNAFTLLIVLMALGVCPAALRAAEAPAQRDAYTYNHMAEKNSLAGQNPVRPSVPQMRGRPKLGLVVMPEMAPGSEAGAMVIGVSPGSPAAVAGLQLGDHIVKANGRKLADYAPANPAGGDAINPAAHGLIEFSSSLKEGDKVTLEFRRSGESRHTSLVARGLPDLHDIAFNGLSGAFMELELTALNPDLGAYFHTQKGVLITQVPVGTALPFKSGDVLTRIGNDEPQNPSQALRRLRALEPGEKITVELIRHRISMRVTVTLPARLPAREARTRLRTPVPAPSMP